MLYKPLGTLVFVGVTCLVVTGYSFAKALEGNMALLEPIGTTTVALTQEKILYVYTTRPGDTLWDISKWVLKNPYLWPELLKFNYISDPNLIFPGEKLIVPSIEVLERIKEAKDVEEIQAIRRETETNAIKLEMSPPAEELSPLTRYSPIVAESQSTTFTPREIVLIPLVESESNSSTTSDLKISGRKNINFNYREYRGGVSPYYFSSGYTRQESMELNLSGQIDKTIKVDGQFYQSDQDLENKYSLKLANRNTELFLGDFAASLPDMEFTLKDRNISGGRLVTDFQNVGGTALVGAVKGIAQYEQFYGNQTQGPYYLKQAPVVFGSERLLLNKKPLSRGTDYIIDYMTGQITFLHYVLDNITLVEVVYESRQTVFPRNLYAGRFWGNPLSWLRLAGAIVREEDPKSAGILTFPSGDTLTPIAQWNYGSDIQAEVNGFGTITGEWVQSKYQANRLTEDEILGQAISAKTQGSVGPVGLKGYYRHTTPDFRMVGSKEQGLDLLNYGGIIDLKNGGPHSLGDYDFKSQLLAGIRQESEQMNGKLGLRLVSWSVLGYQYFQLRENNNAPYPQHIDHLTRRHSGLIEVTQDFWDFGLRAYQEIREGELVERSSATTKNLTLSTGSKNLKWMSLTGSTDYQIVNADGTSITPASVYRVTKAQITGSVTPSDRYTLSADNRWVWDEQYGSTRTLDTKFQIRPIDQFKLDTKYTWESLQGLLGSTYEPVYTQTVAGQVEMIPWQALSARIYPNMRWTSLADSGRTLNLNRTDLINMKYAMINPVSHEAELKRDLYWLADVTSPDLHIQTEQENRKGSYALHMTFSNALAGEGTAVYEQYYKYNFNLSQYNYDQLYGRHRAFGLGVRSSLQEVIRLEGNYTLDFRDQNGTSPQALTRTAYPISTTGQITSQYDLLNNYGSLHERQDTGQAKLTYQWTEILSVYSEGIYNRNEDLNDQSVIQTAVPGCGITLRWQTFRVEAGAKYALSWGGVETSQELYTLLMNYNPAEFIALSLRAQHSKTAAPDAESNEANLNCSVQF